MQKDPEQIRTATFAGCNASCLDMMFNLISKIFADAKEKEDEFESIVAITLFINLLENIKGIEATLANIISFFVKELSTAKTPDYKVMLSQVLCMSFWYSASTTIS